MDIDHNAQNLQDAERQGGIAGQGARDGHPTGDGATAVNQFNTESAKIAEAEATSDGDGEQENRESWWKGFLYDVKFTDVLITIFTGVMVIISIRQNGITTQGNTLIGQANTISGEAAAASKDAAVAAQNTFQLQKAGEVSANEALIATKKTADAAKATADGVARTAGALAAAIELTRQANQTAERAAKAADESNQIAARTNIAAQKAAEAAAETAKETKRSADWYSFAAEKQLRAYLSVSGGSIAFDSAAQKAEAAVTLQNTGRSFAHKVTASGRLICILPDAPVPVSIEEFRPPSIGPNGEFVIRFNTPWEGAVAPSEMVAWVEGRVDYTDEFDKPRFTEFKFVAGESLSDTEFEMVYASDGNSAQ